MTKRCKLHYVAVWIDQRTALLVKYLGDLLPDDDQRRLGTALHMRHGVWSEQHFGDYQHTHVKHFYDQIIRHLEPGDEVLILGPGEAKHILHQQISSHEGSRGEVVEVQNAHEMTERELVRQAEDYFGGLLHQAPSPPRPMN